MQKRWPLHPKPYSYEILECYVRRLAGCYGVRYEYFCLRALGIPAGDSLARQFEQPAPELLQRLSNGTGIPVEQLEQMTRPLVWRRIMEEMNRYAATPEGQAELDGLAQVVAKLLNSATT
jgi:hypothetical protein